MSDIISRLPLEILYRIDKLAHYQSQIIVNRRIEQLVEKIEDAQAIDNLHYIHLHHIKNCKNLLFLTPGSYKKITYKWVYETMHDCYDYNQLNESTKHCTKKQLYDKFNQFYTSNGEQYRSELIISNDRTAYKMRKIII